MFLRSIAVGSKGAIQGARSDTKNSRTTMALPPRRADFSRTVPEIRFHRAIRFFSVSFICPAPQEIRIRGRPAHRTHRQKVPMSVSTPR